MNSEINNANVSKLVSTDSTLQLLIQGIWRGVVFQTDFFSSRSFQLFSLDGSEKLFRVLVEDEELTIRIEKTVLSFNSLKYNGSFKGKFSQDKKKIEGFWVQRGYKFSPSYAIPVTLIQDTNNPKWTGKVALYSEALTLFFKFGVTSENELTVKITNQEKNFGAFFRIGRITIKDTSISIFDRGVNRILFEGTINHAQKTILLTFSMMGCEIPLKLKYLDIDKVVGYKPTQMSANTTGKKYIYSQPAILDDGWEVASLKKMNIDRIKIEELIQKILDETYPNIHSIVIVKDGKLVVDDYFYGFQPDIPHDTRSAGKSLASTLIGIAIEQKLIKDENTPIYSYFTGYKCKNWHPEKNNITLKHLMTMSSGLDCNDNDDTSPGHEDNLQSQDKQPNWVKFTLDLPLINKPGEKSLYCSAGVNVLGGVLLRCTKLHTYEFAHEHLFKPLGIDHYYFNLTPTENGYLGGGIYLRPRDMAKLGQLYLNHGVWNEQRILSEAWIRKATQKHTEMDGKQYGYNWWLYSDVVAGTEYHTFVAGGNGGQFIMVTPQLGLVTVLTGGNYNRYPIWIKFRGFLPNYIIPAITS